jgi:TetR/AcrR family transcriptional repressor of nem operon
MGYEKGRISREAIVEACVGVVLSKGFAATTLADLASAAQTSSGKLTHHFPNKESLFEAVFAHLLEQFEAGPLRTLQSRELPARQRIDRFFDGVLRLYAASPEGLGCPIGHAASDTEGVTAAMKTRAKTFLSEASASLERAYLELDQAPTDARRNATVAINAWQGAVVVARAGSGLAHLRRVFRLVKQIGAASAE